MRSLEEVKNYFVYHAPDEEAREKHQRVTNIFLTVVEMLWELVPPENQGSPDKTVMFRELSRARMEANMAVACFIPSGYEMLDKEYAKNRVDNSPEALPPVSEGYSETPGQEPDSRP